MEPTTSPVPAKEVEYVSFYRALQALAEGYMITKAEWGDNEIYGLLKNGQVMLYKNGSEFTWTISDSDLSGIDWIVR